MSVSGPLNVVFNSPNTFSFDAYRTRRSPQPVVPSQPGMTFEQAREQFRAAAAEFVDAFRGFTSTTKPVFTPSVRATPSIAAALAGLTARIQPTSDVYAVLQTTAKINTQTSTVRSSSSSLNLDLTTASSVLPSSALGLDVTSATAPSELDSSASLGLDLMSPETASVLRSSATLALDVTSAQSASSITSTAEMNTASKSLGASDLAFSGGSTSHIQISGAYSGSATSLTFKITGTATVSSISSLVALSVVDQSNTQVASYTGLFTTGQVIDLSSIGLKVRFTAGSIALNASASTTVSSTPTDVSASALFNAGWGSAPLFENFQTVSAGSFTINGTSIAVNANDSINSVVSRINAAGLGVTASVSGDKISIQTNSNSEDDIVLANDTSGFLAATKLAAATAVRGNVRDDQQVFSKTTQFGSVATGSFSINGVSISVNKDTDTLSSVMSRINSSSAGVTASYDSTLDKVVLTTNANSEDLITVGSDTSGFLAAAKLSTNNTVKGNIRDDLQVLSKTSQFASVTSGTFAINGKTITVDASTDTVAALITKINSAGAGVTASLNSSTNKINLAGTSDSEDLITVGSDSTGFLSAAKLNTNNTVRGNLRDDQQVFSKTSQFAAVSNGSFTLNGKTISVDKDNDSISTLISRINSASAGVTASYNSSTDKLQLTNNAIGRDLITVSGDTTGFLSVAGLVTSNTVRGKLADDQEKLTNVSQFASVVNGSFKINDVSISIDAANDTLQAVISKVNASAAGVTASYNSATGKVVITPNVSGATLAVDSDTSGFLAAAKIATGSAGLHVNADAGFNATGLSVPLFDSGLAVQAGSFKVNGVAITVAANDTVKTVLAKITASSAGVTATYDDSAQTVKLTAKQRTPTPIAVSQDTSGFLTAVKLDGTASSTTGVSISAFDAALRDLPEYSTVHAGTIKVNGTSIAINPATTTIRGLMHALNSVTDISATLDETTGTINLSAKRLGVDIITSDTSGLMSVLDIATGATRATPAKTRIVQTQSGTTQVTNADEVAAKVSAAAQKLNEALGYLNRNDADAAAKRIVDGLGVAGIDGLSWNENRISIDRSKIAAGLKQNAASFATVARGSLDNFASASADAASLKSLDQSFFLLQWAHDFSTALQFKPDPATVAAAYRMV